MTTLKNRKGEARLVHRHDPVWDTLENRRARLSNVEPDGMIELTDNDGRILPDLRHPWQLIAY